MQRPKLGALARWALTVGILAFSGWRLRAAWETVDASALRPDAAPLATSALLGALALITLATLSTAGLRVAGLVSPGATPWLGWGRVWLQSYFYRYVPGKVMLLVERVRLGDRFGLARATSVVLVVWESLLLIAGAGLLAGGALILRPPRADDPVSGPAVAALAAVALAGSLALWPALRALASRFSAVRDRVPGLLLAVPVPAQVGLAAGYGVAWLLFGLSFAALARGLSPLRPDATLLVTWFVASYVGGQVSSVTPAGLGVREGILVAGLAGVVPGPVALAWAVAHRVLLSLVELGVVGGSLLLPLPAERVGGADDAAG